MSLLHIPLDRIDEAQLDALIEAGAPESRCIDYKAQTYGTANADHSEFLADISSFANTSGGDIVIGVEAEHGIPQGKKPLTISIDNEVLRLEQIARTGLQPRIANIAFRAIPLKAGGNVLLIRAPRSYSPPHRVIRQNSNRFWARSTVGKYEPDVNELRSLFNSGPQFAERIRNFRLDRIAKIAAGRAPVQLMNRGTLILHIIPLSAFNAPISLPLEEIRQSYNTFVPLGRGSAGDARINFDGILKTSNANAQAAVHRAYLQLYRSGILEAVTSTLKSDSNIIYNLDDMIVSSVMQIWRDLASVGCDPPVAVVVSLTGVEGAGFSSARTPRAWYDDDTDGLDRDQYHFDEVLLENVPTSIEQCADLIRPLLDQMANIGGRAGSPLFDKQGHYVPLNNQLR